MSFLMTSLSSALAPASSATLPSAFERVVPAGPLPIATKRDLLGMSRAIEGRALAGGATTVLVTFQDRRHVTAATRVSYARLARSGVRVVIFARGLTSDYAPDSDGLLHVALRAADPVVREWDIVVLGASPLAFVARDLQPDTAISGPDLSRTFAWARTTDPRRVTEAADALLGRVPTAG